MSMDKRPSRADLCIVSKHQMVNKMSKVIFITGTSTGFGKLMTLTLSKAGHTVIAGMRGTTG